MCNCLKSWKQETQCLSQNGILNAPSTKAQRALQKSQEEGKSQKIERSIVKWCLLHTIYLIIMFQQLWFPVQGLYKVKPAKNSRINKIHDIQEGPTSYYGAISSGLLLGKGGSFFIEDTVNGRLPIIQVIISALCIHILAALTWISALANKPKKKQ